jgi:predicted component of type VI protein secretion system
MKLSLEVLTAGKMQGKMIPVGVAQFVIGRDPDCQLRPASPLISKRHCALLVRDNKVFVRDFDSTNGTFVNERQLKGELQIQNGDSLKAGPLAFRVHIAAPAGAPVSKTTPLPPTKAAPSADDTELDTAALSAGAAKKPAAAGTDDTDADAAALLLSMADDDPAPGSPGVDSQGIPTGSTVMDMLSPPEGEGAAPGAKGPEGKAGGKPGQAAANKMGDTSAAAKSILDKYWRRPRV